VIPLCGVERIGDGRLREALSLMVRDICKSSSFIVTVPPSRGAGGPSFRDGDRRTSTPAVVAASGAREHHPATSVVPGPLFAPTCRLRGQVPQKWPCDVPLLRCVSSLPRNSRFERKGKPSAPLSFGHRVLGIAWLCLYRRRLSLKGPTGSRAVKSVVLTMSRPGDGNLGPQALDGRPGIGRNSVRPRLLG
jgi:hypothetical protein